MLKSLVEYIIKSLVENTQAVRIDYADRDGKKVLVISVDKGDMGRVIGKDGQTIKAIRALSFAADTQGDVSDIVIDDNE